MLNVLHLSYFHVYMSFALTPDLATFYCTVPSSFAFHDTFMHTRNFHNLYTVCTFLLTAIFLNINIKDISFFPVVLSLSLSLLSALRQSHLRKINLTPRKLMFEKFIIV